MKLTPWKLPAITDKCGSHLTYRDFVECGTTWHDSRIDNVPKRPATYVALRDLCVNILDPVIDHFGRIELEFATIGDTVNVASRLELITRDLAA
jgi:hypothetical protein